MFILYTSFFLLLSLQFICWYLFYTILLQNCVYLFLRFDCIFIRMLVCVCVCIFVASIVFKGSTRVVLLILTFACLCCENVLVFVFLSFFCMCVFYLMLYITLFGLLVRYWCPFTFGNRCLVNCSLYQLISDDPKEDCIHTKRYNGEMVANQTCHIWKYIGGDYFKLCSFWVVNEQNNTLLLLLNWYNCSQDVSRFKNLIIVCVNKFICSRHLIQMSRLKRSRLRTNNGV